MLEAGLGAGSLCRLAHTPDVVVRDARLLWGDSLGVLRKIHRASAVLVPMPTACKEAIGH